ncbi:hypothetical protein ACIPI6_12780 [Pseudomonas protegens]|uniref:hypothetical protein n=1 Tax=Pseudomonas protegens TaxID=380021 RepID=UPI0037F572DF
MNAECVYCGQANEFNGEHMFPAGLGGDDKRFMIKDCVCEVCNTYFSKLEGELSRRTPSALARLIKQSQGRNRGRKSSEPVIQTESSYIIDDGRLLEAKISAKMTASLVPQIHVDGMRILFTANEHHTLEAFLEACREVLLAPEIRVIEKKTEASGTHYLVRVVSYDGEKPTIGDYIVTNKAPVKSVWIKEPLQKSKHNSDGNVANLTPRFYHHEGRTITYKSPDPSNILEDIAKVRQFLAAPNVETSYTDSTIDSPLVSVEMGFDILSVFQAYAKIGMNFIIHLGGHEYARESGFASIKSKIRKQGSEIQVRAIDETDPFYHALGIYPDEAHCMALHSFAIGEGRSSIFFHLKLYGGPIHEIVIAESVPTPAWGIESKYALIYFNEHRIELLDENEYFSIQAKYSSTAR